MLKVINYKGFNIVKTGTKEFPYNIYKDDGYGFGTWCGFEKTIKACKEAINEGLFD